MQTGNTIQNELNEISPFLAQIPKTNPFWVPDGYFIELENELLITSQSNKYIPFEQLGNQMNDVPEGYFDNLAGNILSAIKAQNSEHLSTGPDLKVSKENVFLVPEGYFDGFAASVLEKINPEAGETFSPIIEAIGKTNIYSIPNGYFENFADGTLAELSTQRIKNIAGNINVFSLPEGYFESISARAVSNTWSKANVYTVPEGYFKQLPAEILNKVSNKGARVIEMKAAPQAKVFNLRRIAAAASIALLMGLSTWFLYNKTTDVNNNATFAAAENIVETNSFDKALQSLSSEEISNYLEAKGTNVTAALVADAAMDETLPAAEDYLFDDNTLKEFLKTTTGIN